MKIENVFWILCFYFFCPWNMDNVESRFLSFFNSSINYTDIEKMKFALCGFYMDDESSDIFIATCFYCEKSLSNWETNDIPLKEHLKRHLNCALLQLNFRKHRQRTFRKAGLNGNVLKLLIENGFFFYPLKPESKDVFCYRCGYFLNRFGHDLTQKLSEHSAKCNYKNKTSIISIDHCIVNAENLFFLQLISGEYAKQLIQITKRKKQILSSKQKKNVLQLLSYHDSNNPFECTENVLKRCLSEMADKALKEMENDEDEVHILFEENK